MLLLVAAKVCLTGAFVFLWFSCFRLCCWCWLSWVFAGSGGVDDGRKSEGTLLLFRFCFWEARKQTYDEIAPLPSPGDVRQVQDALWTVQKARRKDFAEAPSDASHVVCH